MTRPRYNGSRACPTVSDHALLRYLQRVKGVDLDAIRAEILSPTMRAAIQAGASAVNINGHLYAIRNDGCVVTVLPAGARGYRGDHRRGEAR
jgi:hypothetical protein